MNRAARLHESLLLRSLSVFSQIKPAPPPPSPPGDVQIFDLGCSALKPAATIEQGAPGHAATCLAFNGQRPQLLAAGATDGTLGVWQLSSDLTEQIAAESSRLEQIAEQVVD